MISRSEFVALLAALGVAGGPAAAESASLPPWYPLPPRLPVDKRRALVLSGAGARGAYEAGVLKWLFRDVAKGGLPYDLICGTSAGAINSAFAAQGTSGAIAQTELLWKGMPASKVIQFEEPVQHLMNAGLEMQEAARHGYPARLSYFGRARREVRAAGPPEDLIKLMGVVDPAGIAALLVKYPLNLGALQTSVLITATNVTKMSADSFYKFVGADAAERERLFIQRGAYRPHFEASAGAPPLRPRPPLHHLLTPENFSEAVIASASVPGVFQPMAVKRAEELDPYLYVDGGVANNTPIGLAVDAGATDLTVVMASAPNEVPKIPTSLPGLLQASFAIMQQRLLQNDITIAFTKNLLGRLVKRSGLNQTVQNYIDSLQNEKWEPLELRVIQPLQPLGLTMMGFDDQAGIDAAFDQGYADAQRPYTYTMT